MEPGIFAEKSEVIPFGHEIQDDITNPNDDDDDEL